MQIFDPMDRPIENDEGQNVATGSAALLKQIEDLPRIVGDGTKKLNVPLSAEQFEQLEALYRTQEWIYTEQGCKYLQDADENDQP